MRRLARPAAALALAAGLAACSTGGSSADRSAAPATSAATPSSTVTPPSPPATPPPLGEDIKCMNPQLCYLQNPLQLTDAQLVEYFRTVPGAGKAPTADMRPWAYVVLGAGQQKLAGSTEASASGKPVTDDIGVLNHRALFAYCRQAEGGGPVTATTPADKVWYLMDPFAVGSPAVVWMNGKHLVPYGHDGAIPAC